MRPILKKTNPRKVKNYQNYKADLLTEIGTYCSYCERHTTDLHIEHIKPKSQYPELECEWDNLLLACVNCNATKGNKDFDLNKILLPHRDNTFRAFRYSQGGVVSALEGMSWTAQARATIKMVGLDKTPASDPKASDSRWKDRLDAWNIANRCKNIYRDSHSIELIIYLARESGFWSVWMSVFQDNNAVKERLIQAFSGTAQDCFDATQNYAPLPRENGQC